MKNKKIYLVIALIGVMSIIFGVTYAFFEYSKIGANHELIAGDIYMNFNEGTDSLSLGSVYPESVEHARSRDDNYITFTIDGKNESDKDIYYEIDLIHGDDHDGLTRFNDKDLRFDLSEIDGEEENILIGNVNFEELNNAKIWADTIGKDGSNSVKLKDPHYEVNISNCVNYFNDFYEEDLTLEQDGYQSFCSGEGKIDDVNGINLGYIYLNDFITIFSNSPFDNGDYNIDNLIDNNVISNLTFSYKYYTLKPNYDSSSCMSLLSRVSYPFDASDDEDGYEKFCEGTGTTLGYTISELFMQDIVDAGLGNASIVTFLSALTIIDTDNELLIPGSGSSNKTYKLRMWLSEDVLISDTEPDADYTATDYKNHYASIKVRVVGDFEEKTMPQPVYYAFADIADIDYSYFETDTDIMTIPGITNNYSTIGHNNFIKFEGPEKSVCAIINGNLECFKNNNYENEKAHLQSIFEETDCDEGSSNFYCYDGTWYCDVNSNGRVECNDPSTTNDYCGLNGDGSFGCQVMDN